MAITQSIVPQRLCYRGTILIDDEDDGVSIEDADEPEVDSPIRSRIAIEMMCAAVLRRAPSLGHIEVANIRDLPHSEQRNWELAATTPELSPAEWTLALRTIEPWRERYRLADGSNANVANSMKRKASPGWIDPAITDRRKKK